MTGLEIACVICGMVGMLLTINPRIRYNDFKEFVILIVLTIIEILVFLAMVLLPFYFRYWR